jgi:hypothetical protein
MALKTDEVSYTVLVVSREEQSLSFGFDGDSGA